MSDGGTNPQGWTGLGTKAAELAHSATVKITREAFKDAPPAMKAVLYAPAISGAVFGIALLAALATSAWVAVFFGLLLLVGLYFPHFVPLRLDASMLRLAGVDPGTSADLTRADPTPHRCRSFPIFPLAPEAITFVKPALEEVRQDAARFLQEKHAGIPDKDVRANVFLLAKITGGAASGTWKLVIHPDLAINMDYPPELGLQFCIGQGATGVAYRDGVYRLTRRLANPPKKGEWSVEFKMTPELNAQIHPRLKWIVSMPLLRPNTSEAVGVLNIDGLHDVPEDETLHTMAGRIRENVDALAKYLSLQPSTCLGIHELGVLGNG